MLYGSVQIWLRLVCYHILRFGLVFGYDWSVITRFRVQSSFGYDYSVITRFRVQSNSVKKKFNFFSICLFGGLFIFISRVQSRSATTFTGSDRAASLRCARPTVPPKPPTHCKTTQV